MICNRPVVISFTASFRKQIIGTFFENKLRVLRMSDFLEIFVLSFCTWKSWNSKVVILVNFKWNNICQFTVGFLYEEI